jgi:hypothetical protein
MLRSVCTSIATGKGLCYVFKVLAEVSIMLLRDTTPVADSQWRSDVSRHNRYLIGGARVACIDHVQPLEVANERTVTAICCP